MTDLNMQGCTLIQVLAITINKDKKQKFTLTCTEILVFKCELLMMNTRPWLSWFTTQCTLMNKRNTNIFDIVSMCKCLEVKIIKNKLV